jgi:opacity protein-like surface antigen
MLNMTKLALAAALALGAVSAAQANDNDRNDRGGYRVGPLGQSFPGANPAYHPSMRYGDPYGDGAYAFVPGYRFPNRHYRRWDWDWN